jgi:hypothetical protein
MMPALLFFDLHLPTPLPVEARAAGSDELSRGERVAFEGRTFVIRGFDPSGASGRRVYLEDAETHEFRTAVLADVLVRP